MTEAPPEQQINFFSFDSGSLQDLHAELWAKFSQEKSALHFVMAPNVALDNSHHISFSIQMDSVMLFELLGEFFLLKAGRKVSTDSASASYTAPSHMMIDYPNELSSSSASEQSNDTGLTVDIKGKGKMVAEQPECTSQVRRSSRSNKYDGFNHKNLSEARAFKSKVKQRAIPSVKQKILKKKKSSTAVIIQDDPSVQTATPIPVLQAIGINLCGVPQEELTEGRLLAPSLAEEQLASKEEGGSKSIA
jgi:hypothetical protein